MMKSRRTRWATWWALGLAPAAWIPTALAHEGHAMPGSTHWHAGDSALVLLAVAIAVVAYVIARRQP